MQCHISSSYTSHERTPMQRESLCERERWGAGQRGPSERERSRCRKSQRITGRWGEKVVIRITLISPPLRAFLFQAPGNIFSGWNHKGPPFLCEAARMEWNEVDLVQEFTVEGQCSKIKVRSCRITWDSLQVNTARWESDRRCVLMSGARSSTVCRMLYFGVLTVRVAEYIRRVSW